MSGTTFALGTFSIAGSAPFGALVVGERVLALRAARQWLEARREPLASDGSMRDLLGHWDADLPRLQRVADAVLAGEGSLAAQCAPPGALRRHAPFEPRNVFCAGANYRKHVVDIIIAQSMRETADMDAATRRAWGERKMDERAANGTPYFFLKSTSCVVGPDDPVIIPADVTTADWELELGVVIGRRARRVDRERALACVAGYVVANDLTSRERVNRRPGDVNEMGMNWVAAKSSPTFLPLGPHLVPSRFVADPQDLRILLKLNGQVMQDESTADMIFGIARLIEDLSVAIELQPGDLICTGSPAGNGVHHGRMLRPGDLLEGSITGLGTQRNPCIAEPA